MYRSTARVFTSDGNSEVREARGIDLSQCLALILSSVQFLGVQLPQSCHLELPFMLAPEVIRLAMGTQYQISLYHFLIWIHQEFGPVKPFFHSTEKGQPNKTLLTYMGRK